MIEVLLIFQAVVWLAACWAFLCSRNASAFHPFAFYLAFHGVVFVTRPILEYLFHFETVFYLMEFYPSDEVIQFTFVLTSFALVVFAAANLLPRAGGPRFDRAEPEAFTPLEWRAFCILVVLIGPIALYSAYATLGTSVFGDPVIQMDRDPRTGVLFFTNTTGYLYVAQEAFGVLSLMLIWGTRFKLWSFVPLLAYLSLRVYFGRGRWTIVLTLMMLGLLYLFHHHRRWPPIRFAILAIPVFVLFQQLGENRDAIKTWLTGEVTSHSQPALADRSWIERQDNPDFANFDFLTYVVDAVPEKTGTYTYFSDFLQLFTEPIPRILWPGKPFGAPIQLIDLNSYGNFDGWTLSLVGMGWISFGWLGVAILLALVGYLTARLHRWFWSGEATNFKILAYCVFVPLTLQWFRDGDISIAKFVFTMIGPLLLWRVILKFLRANSLRGRPADRVEPSSLSY